VVFVWMSLGFIAREYGLAGSPAIRLRAILAFVADIVWYVLTKFLLVERGNFRVKVTMIESGLLKLCRYSASRLDSKSQVTLFLSVS